MIQKNSLLFLVLCTCLLSINTLIGQQLVEKVQINPEEAILEFKENNMKGYLLEIGGPDAFYWKQEIDQVENLKMSPHFADGKTFKDGSYTLQVTPFYRLSEQQRTDLRAAQANGGEAAMKAYRVANNLPAMVEVFTVNFGIRDGHFISPKQKEAKIALPTMSSVWTPDHPSLYASLQTKTIDLGIKLPKDNASIIAEDQVFIDDVIVDGSICVGQDCVNGENFGFDTQRIKENNLRIHFDDTSASASFPSNDWRITINDSSNGGSNYFAIEDATAGNIPFRVEAGAGANALHVSSSGGNVGFGTATPVVEAHVADGDSPTLRLEQNGASGWTPQTWDIAGNETNFFVRDVTNGSKLPFKIKPGAPDNSLFLAASGDIGLGTQNPSEALQVESGNVYVKSGNLGINTVPTVALHVIGNTIIEGNPVIKGTTTFRGDENHFLTGNASWFNTTFMPLFKLDPVNNRVGIGTNAPGHQLELSIDDAAKPNGGMWTAASDRRLKTNIKDFNIGLDAILKIRPVTYNYNGKLDMPTEKEFVGVIAQEMREVAPFTVTKLKKAAPAGEDDYLAVDGTPITYMMINAIQEQQAIIATQQAEIDQLKNELGEIALLKTQLSSLSKMVAELNTATEHATEKESAERIGEKK